MIFCCFFFWQIRTNINLFNKALLVSHDYSYYTKLYRIVELATFFQWQELPSANGGGLLA